MDSKPFDLFFRNPFNYHRELAECGEVDVSWDRGLLLRKGVDQQRFSQTSFKRTGKFWRSYSISSWDCIEYDAECKKGRPRAVYPTFDWQGDQMKHLLEYITSPWGEDEDIINSPELESAERPVAGQPHKVFITGLPNCRVMEGKHAIVELARLQRMCPEVEIFIHRLFGYGDLFNNFRAGDLEPRTRASKGMIQLSNGKYFDPRDKSRNELAGLIRATPWEPEDLEDASNRCKFNIESARHGSLHWNKEGRMPLNIPSNYKPDVDSSSVDVTPITVKKKHLLITPALSQEIR